MKKNPVIGVAGRKLTELPEKHCYTVPKEYFDALRNSGGLPLLIPPFASEEECGEYAAMLDGMLFIGGPDIPPAFYGQEPRPEVMPLPEELAASYMCMARLVLARPVPVLGICLGCQLLNVASGGGLIQHLEALMPRHLNREVPGTDQYHTAELLSGSRIAGILGEGKITVNSSHHQAVDPEHLGMNWQIAARDGSTVEAIEQPGEVFRMGLQWHPERIRDTEQQRKIFDAFVRSCSAQ